MAWVWRRFCPVATMKKSVNASAFLRSSTSTSSANLSRMAATVAVMATGTRARLGVVVVFVLFPLLVLAMQGTYHRGTRTV